MDILLDITYNFEYFHVLLTFTSPFFNIRGNHYPELC